MLFLQGAVFQCQRILDQRRLWEIRVFFAAPDSAEPCLSGHRNQGVQPLVAFIEGLDASAQNHIFESGQLVMGDQGMQDHLFDARRVQDQHMGPVFGQIQLGNQLVRHIGIDICLAGFADAGEQIGQPGKGAQAGIFRHVQNPQPALAGEPADRDGQDLDSRLSGHLLFQGPGPRGVGLDQEDLLGVQVLKLSKVLCLTGPDIEDGSKRRRRVQIQGRGHEKKSFGALTGSIHFCLGGLCWAFNRLVRVFTKSAQQTVVLWPCRYPAPNSRIFCAHSHFEAKQLALYLFSCCNG